MLAKSEIRSYSLFLVNPTIGKDSNNCKTFADCVNDALKKIISFSKVHLDPMNENKCEYELLISCYNTGKKSYNRFRRNIKQSYPAVEFIESRSGRLR